MKYFTLKETERLNQTIKYIQDVQVAIRERIDKYNIPVAELYIDSFKEKAYNNLVAQEQIKGEVQYFVFMQNVQPLLQLDLGFLQKCVSNCKQAGSANPDLYQLYPAQKEQKNCIGYWANLELAEVPQARIFEHTKELQLVLKQIDKLNRELDKSKELLGMSTHNTLGLIYWDMRMENAYTNAISEDETRLHKIRQALKLS